MNNYALYYPTIEFNDYEWLWAASLLWDRIYRIVPSGYKPHDVENVRILTEAGEIGIPIHPDQYSATVADDFIKRLENGEWAAAAVETEIPEEYARLHKDKVDVKLRELLITKGSGAAYKEWLYVPTQFEALYMTYLANHIATVNKLQLLSDSTAAWTGSTYFRYDGDVQDYPSEEYVQQLAVLVLRDFLPENLLSISPDQMLKFREKYRPERQRFLETMRKSAHDLSSCADPSIIKDMIEDLKKDIEASLKDYRKAVETLNVTAWIGIKSLSFPVATKIASMISGAELDPSTLLIVSGLGVALGLVSGLADWRQKLKKLEKECDYSYLLHLSRKWQKCARYEKDYNYLLCREMEEFIND
jgi:hypothetical protein